MSTNHENFPAQIDRILTELKVIKKIIENLEKPEEIPKRLTFEKGLQLLNEQSFELSKSLLYKKVAAKQVPHYHFGNRIVFDTKELIDWAEQQLKRRKL